jgi:hypothetical protein
MRSVRIELLIELSSLDRDAAGDVGDDRADDDFIAFEPANEAITVELLALDGTTVGEAIASPDQIRVRTAGLAPGNYALRVSRADDAGPEQAPIELRVRPPI